MTPLEVARMLAAHGTRDDDRPCRYCSGEDDEHESDCPGLALPKIVAALEAASALVDNSPDSEDEPTREHGVDHIDGYVFCDGDRKRGHGTACRWHLLVTALKGEPT